MQATYTLLDLFNKNSTNVVLFADMYMALNGQYKNQTLDYNKAEKLNNKVILLNSLKL